MEDTLYAEFYDPSSDYLSEPRSFCYDIATQLVNQAKERNPTQWHDEIDTVKGILLLLFTWNYVAQETKKLNCANVQNLLRNSSDELRSLEGYSILTDNFLIWEKVGIVFDRFRMLLGQTGASKALSLLNPQLFVMWDTAIRKRLNKRLIPGIMNGESGENYVRFLMGIQNIIRKYGIKDKLPPDAIIAKKIDEYHYVKISMDKEIRQPKSEEPAPRFPSDQIRLPDNLRGRSIHTEVIPTVCNLKNMLAKLIEIKGDYSQLKNFEKRSYKAYQISKIQTEILQSAEENWKEIIKNHILKGKPEDFGASCIDIYLVAFVADTVGAGRNNFIEYIRKVGISQKDNTAQAIWQVGKGDGVFLGLLYPDGRIKDTEFFKSWSSGSSR